MVEVWVTGGEVAVLGRPLDDAADELLLRGLVGREGAQQGEHAGFAGCGGLRLGFLVDFHQVVAQVGARPALAGFEEQRRARGEEVDGGIVIGGADVAVSNGSELLVGFVEVAFFYAKERSDGAGNCGRAVTVPRLLSRQDLLDLGRHCGGYADVLGWL